MKIVDTFPFSEPYEATLLWLKLNLEEALVDEWVILENAYSFQGEYKGVWAEYVITQDQRFARFRDRITILQGDFKPEAVYDRAGVYDHLAFEAEYAQRELAREHVLNTYGDEDYVLISDVDEMLDCTSSEKINLLLRRIKRDPHRLIRIPRTRFWYDFDNLWLMSGSVPLVPLKMLREHPWQIAEMRKHNVGPVKAWPQKMLFEYSFCFTFDEIMRKCVTQSHTGLTLEEMTLSVRCNHIPVSSKRAVEISIHPRFWLEQVELNEKNSPALVRENLASLKTNVVDPAYQTNRTIYYPQFFPTRGYRRVVAQTRKAMLLKQYRLFVQYPGVQRWHRRFTKYLTPIFFRSRVTHV